MGHKLHIISFDIPYPPDYGGVIDVFYKVKALYNLGVKIHLHCFEYHRPPAPQLEKYCEKVYYYPRKISGKLLFHKLPYIVVSRTSDELLQNLQKNSWPILAEGLHCTALLDRYWTNRKFIVRTHNVEHEYYKQLGKAEKNLFKKYYFLNESTKLENYEPILANSQGIAAITDKDKEHFNKYHHNVKTISAFHGDSKVNSVPGVGKFVLYHGNLAVSENHKAAAFVAEAMKDSNVQLIIAGNSPKKELKEIIRSYPNIMLIANPTAAEMTKLIKDAHVNAMVTFQSTGLKLKLLHSLFNGRHCLVNKMMVEGTGLEDAVTICDTDETMEFKARIEKLMQVQFTSDQVEERKIILAPFTDNESANKLVKMIFE